MPESKIVKNQNAFLLEIDGKAMPMYGYMTYQPEKGCYEAFKKAGVHLFFVAVYAGDRGINQWSGIRPFRKGFWKGYHNYDFEEVEADFRRIVGNDAPGEVYIVPRLMVEVPTWWDDLNPGELSRDAHGTPLHASFASKKWIKDAEEMFIDLQAWLERSGWDRYVVGWHIAAGNTEEFIRPMHRTSQLSDYSEPAAEAFRDWAWEHYNGNIAALNQAWRRSFRSFNDITIPSPAKRIYAVLGDLRDEELERETVDYYRYMNEVQAKAAVALCSAAKKATHEKIVVGAFFGYTVCEEELGQHAAHIAFESDRIDFLASPFAYTKSRGQGVDWAFQGSVDSAALHGKPWFMEADVRTCLSRPISRAMPHADPVVNRAYDGPVWWGPKDIKGSLGQMAKALGRIMTNNTAVWWFDMWGGWYDDPELMDFQRKACTLYRENVMTGGSRNMAEIALFMDDETYHRMAPLGHYCAVQGYELWEKMGFIGAPYRYFMIEDLPSVDPGSFRMAIFASVSGWKDRDLTALKKWKKDDRVIAFLGPTRSYEASEVFMTGGEALEELPENLSLRFPDVRFSTIPGDVVFGKDEKGVKALLRRKESYSIYADLAIAPSPERFSELLNAAGGQIYSDTGDVIYADERRVVIHAASEGVKRIHIPGKGKLKNALTGEVLPGNESFAELKMELGDTCILNIIR